MDSGSDCAEPALDFRIPHFSARNPAMSSPWTPQGKMPPVNFNGIKGLPPGFFTGGAAVIALVVVLFSTYFTIDQGERGVILHWGAIAGEAEPGLHFKMPIITTVEKISVQIQKEGFEKSG